MTHQPILMVKLNKEKVSPTTGGIIMHDKGEYVLICVAWPYANGPLHLGHVAGCYLPPDIQARFERALGNRVLMVSGSDEHGTPITVTAEIEGVDPQDIVDKFHSINNQALIDLGCSWQPSIDHRGVEYGGSLFNRTTDPRHKEIVQENFLKLQNAGLFELRTTKQYYEINESGNGRFLPDRYVEGTCPSCDSDDARGDQCDECGATYEAIELKNPRSKMNPDAKIEIRDTDHFFYRLDLFQEVLEQHAESQTQVWKSNVKAMTKQWLDMGLRPRAVTRDLSWGIQLPLQDSKWDGKCVYVWFEAVQGYSTCAQIWSERYAIDAGHSKGAEAWKDWWMISENGISPRHLYFLGKDNIPFHTVIWPALIMGLNHANNGHDYSQKITLPNSGDLALESNVPAMEYLMLAGGQFSKSRKHAVWLPAFLDRFDPDTLRYYLSINMPENHDTDFNWPDFVEKVNSELIASYGNFVHRILTLGARLPKGNRGPFADIEINEISNLHKQKLEQFHFNITESLRRHRFKEALRSAMNASQYGNQIIQAAEPWKYLSDPNSENAKNSIATLAFGWRICRFLSIVTQPFLPFSAQRLWIALGQEGQVSQTKWDSAIDWNAEMTWNDDKPEPLFKRLDLNEILEQEQSLVSESVIDVSNPTHSVKGGKNSGGKNMENKVEGIKYLQFDDFMKVELKVAKITNVEDHPNADKLYVIKLDDGKNGRTICAGIKEYYQPEHLLGKSVVFVANLQPRPLRGVTSEGMILAADDGNGTVKLVTIDGTISNGSQVR